MCQARAKLIGLLQDLWICKSFEYNQVSIFIFSHTDYVRNVRLDKPKFFLPIQDSCYYVLTGHWSLICYYILFTTKSDH